MSKSAVVQARMEPELKAEADAVLAALGINATTAITLFYTQVVRHRGIPLELKVPNDAVVAAMRELKDPAARSKLKRHDSVDALMRDLTA
jgi:DNA-damage-inducible protein J